MPKIRNIVQPPFTIQKFVSHYITNAIISELSGIKTYQAAISMMSNGKLCRHQYRVAKNARNAFTRNLRSFNNITAGCSTFEDLHSVVKTCVVKGIGPLTVYDTAMRIAWVLNQKLLPCNYIYLNAGAYSGATYFQSQFPSVFPSGVKHCISTQSFNLPSNISLPIPSSMTLPMIIEDFLCAV